MKAKDHTEEFLQAVAERLSGRTDCKKVQYIIYIGRAPRSEAEAHHSNVLDMKSADRVFILPNYEIYPDIHHRKKTDLVGVLDYILITRFHNSVFNGLNEYGHAVFKPDTLTPGVYQYKLSVDEKRRKWIRLI